MESGEPTEHIGTCIETILDSDSHPGSPQSTDLTKIKAKSAPVVPQTPSEEAEVREQISAPAYLNCLRENDEPPFRKPDKEPRPCIITGTIMNEAEAVAMVEAAEIDGERGLGKFLGKLVFLYKFLN